MRLILILVVLAVVGVLTTRALKTQSSSVADAARQAGVEVAQSATPSEQVRAVGAAMEKMQAEASARQRQELEKSGAQ